MVSILRATANETSLNSTPTTVSNARLVRVLNNSASAALLITTNNGVNAASITIIANTEVLIRKYNADQLLANTAANSFLVVPMSFENN